MDNKTKTTLKPLTIEARENDVIAGSKDFSGFLTDSIAKSTSKSFSLEAIEDIAGSKDFSGFFTASEISQVLESNPSAVFSMTAENETQGKIDHPLEGDRPQTELEEPLANSTLVEQDKEESNSSVPVISAKQRQRRAYRKRKAMQAKLNRLTLKPNGDGSQVPEAGPSSAKSPVHDSLSAKRQKTGNSGETPEPKRPRQGGSPREKPSYAAASRRALFLRIVPLDSEGNDISPGPDDRNFIVAKLEDFIVRTSPNIIINEFSLKGDHLRLSCLDQRTLDSVKSVVSPLKGPRGNLQGYRCLGPDDRPPLVTYGVWVAKPVPKKNQLIALLKDANSWINPMKMVVRAEIPKEKGSTFLIGVQPEIRMELLRRNFKLHYGVGRTAHFKAKSKGQQTRADEAT